MPDRPQIAALVTELRQYAHGQHFVDRFLEGYGWEGRHHRPPVDLVSLYVDQHPEGDLTDDRVSRFPMLRLFSSVAEALTLGRDALAVDGVLLIAEHGAYPANEKGQKLYPRYELFEQILSVFRASGRTAPLFNDKHLSWNWDWCRAMYDASLELGFPFMAGSSLPVTWRTPAVEMPLDAEVEEAVCVASGGLDGGDIHAMETLQCMVERRQGGECGVRWLQAYRGEAFWQAHHDGLWSRELFEACLCRSHTLTPARAGFNHHLPTLDEQKQLAADPWAYQFEHLDGLKSTVIMVNGLVRDFNFAARLRGREEPLSTQMYLPAPPAHTTLANFFSPQVNCIERMFITGRPIYPVERTLLTSGLVITGVDSLHLDQARISTPHLQIAYTPTPESTFCRS